MDTVQQIERFADELRRQEKSRNTIKSYHSDLVLFARWLEATNGEAFEADRITQTDLREYRNYLLTVEHRSPATINRRLASLRTFFHWARAEGLCREIPTDQVKGIQSSPRAPKALPKAAQSALLPELRRLRHASRSIRVRASLPGPQTMAMGRGAHGVHHAVHCRLGANR
jgi:integrase/recombinase XerD